VPCQNATGSASRGGATPAVQPREDAAKGSLATALSRAEIGGDGSGVAARGCEGGGISEIGGPSGWPGC
jgi:hypothetical protein